MAELCEKEKQQEVLVKQKVRECISGVYDIQALRIATGNRLVSLFTKSLGMEPSTKLDDEDNAFVNQVIKQLEKEYNRIADAIAEKPMSVKKAIESVRTKSVQVKANGKDVTEKALVYINSKTDFELVSSYMILLESEAKLTKVLDGFVKSHPLYDAFFKDIKGCGTLMSAMCIAYLDPYKARHCSSFYKYCGLDTVQDVDKEGNPLWLTGYLDQTGEFHRTGQVVRQRVGYLDQYGDNYFGDVKPTESYDFEGNRLYRTEDGEMCTMYYETRRVNGEDMPVYEDIETGAEYIGEVRRSEHGRRMGDAEMCPYVDKNGETKMKRSITYNPKLKAKLVEVLTSSMIKQKDPVYYTIYKDYAARLEKSESHKAKTGMHRARMAKRYMAKQFLRNLWVCWRELEGLPVDEPYEVAKLGYRPHALNEAQCIAARRYQEMQQ